MRFCCDSLFWRAENVKSRFSLNIRPQEFGCLAKELRSILLMHNAKEVEPLHTHGLFGIRIRLNPPNSSGSLLAIKQHTKTLNLDFSAPCGCNSVASIRNVVQPSLIDGVTFGLVMGLNVSDDLMPHGFSIACLRWCQIVTCQLDQIGNFVVKFLKFCEAICFLACNLHCGNCDFFFGR